MRPNSATGYVATAWRTVVALVFAVCILWLTIGRNSEPTYSSFTIDLRGTSPLRGVDHDGVARAIEILHRPLDLIIQLPLGSEEGSYEVSIRNEQKILWSTRVFAHLNNHVTTVNTRVDLSPFVAGNYQMIVESEDGTRFEYPLQVRSLH